MAASTNADHREHPVFWFYLLDKAVEAGNFVRAAQAQRELERLGVTVRYRVRPVKAKSPGVTPCK